MFDPILPPSYDKNVMSLLDGAGSAVAGAVARVASELESGTAMDRAMLLNLTEEDRVPGDARERFQKQLAGAPGSAVARVARACESAKLSVSIGETERDRLPPAWRHYASLRKLRKLGYVSNAASLDSEAPPIVSLAHPYGAGRDGTLRAFYATTARGDDADNLRDRLGLDSVRAGDALYFVDVPGAPSRKLHVPAAPDADARPPWRRPPRDHVAPWGLTRDLQSDAPSEPELLAHPLPDDPREARRIGRVARSPSAEYLAKRISS